ncbi:MAG: hypothetical protein HYZ58_00935, partial [Acidobacteria bacterium]|nr:hypothetical protein [Acidobacteriota bacterium]
MSLSDKERLLLLAGIATAVAVASLVIRAFAGRTAATPSKAPTVAEKPGTTSKMPKTLWGEPDLQGIWSREVDIPLERPAKYANQEFFTDAERAELDGLISDIINRDSTESRRARGTERDVNSEFAQAPFTVHLPVGRRTSLIVDPADGRIPRLTPEAQKARDALRQFQLALLQPTAACKEKHPGCSGGKYGPVSPRRNETPPVYLSGPATNINRADGPEDRSQGERCIGSPLPDFGSFVGGSSRIVQAPGELSMFYETIAGLGRHRNIPITSAPHLPAAIRQWWGDSRGHWEGDTLVVDVTNFSPKSNFQGAHENLHLVERWTRLDADTLEYAVTIDDPITWTRPWTVKQELKKQSDKANHIYYEPRCHEGNYGLVGLLSGARAAERAFAQGRGPDPARLCIVIGGCGGFVRGGFADEGPDADPLRSPPP